MMQQLIFLGLMVWCTDVQAVVIGSNTAPSRQGVASFPAADADNEMRGFAIFEQGVTLATSATTARFNSFYPVSGSIALNNGTLTLQRNMVLGSTAAFTTGGTIMGAGFSIEFPSKVGAFVLSGALTFNNTQLILNSDVQLGAAITFSGDCTIIGNGHTLNLSTGSCVVASGATLRLQNTNIINVATGKLSCSGTSSVIELDGVKWLQSGDFVFSQGALQIVGNAYMFGGYNFTYSTSQVSTIGIKGMWYFGNDMRFVYQPASSAKCLISMIGSKSTLYLADATLQAGTGGLQLIKGALVCEGQCTFASSGSTAANGIIFGDGVLASNDLTLICDADSGPYVSSGYVVAKNVGG